MSGAEKNEPCTGADCPEARLEQIYEYLDGVLTDAELATVQRHLEECKRCGDEYDLECLIRAALKRSCREKAPQQLRASIQMRLTQVTVYRSE
ncbi:mycothiol system anti-sigma-R factor [Micrococcoides hystricis]|uniref:Mycothiol system anti-sigma-R factor n=1 Tax=Micrococcoides hystricis TaxID=1572761 RepID=A0ABV6PBP7_9MICC